MLSRLVSRRRGGTGDSQWIEVADLAAAFLLILALVTVFWPTPTPCDEIYKHLETAFCDKSKGSGQCILSRDDSVIIARFDSSQNVLFQVGEAAITPVFKKRLRDFFPKFMEVLGGLKDEIRKEIQEIGIEGHTSSEWGNIQGAGAYTRNMDLSQERASAVFKFVSGLPQAPDYPKWAKDIISPVGRSSSRLIFTSGKENKELSRRVEFRLLIPECRRE